MGMITFPYITAHSHKNNYAHKMDAHAVNVQSDKRLFALGTRTTNDSEPKYSRHLPV